MDIRVTSSPRLLPPSVTPPSPGVPPAGAGVPPLGVPPVDGIPGVAPGGHRPGSPLERSGIDLQALLATEDQLASREAVQGGELEVGLEQARGALVRRAPHETMAILDQVWDGAQRSEEGWYLRAGALVGLGLDEDGDRVAGDGLTHRPDSTALRYARSLARLGTGDVGGARVALEEALALRPREPLLALQHALVRARQGDTSGAALDIDAVAARHPDHPALGYARHMLGSLAAEARRSAPGVEVPSPLAPSSAMAPLVVATRPASPERDTPPSASASPAPASAPASPSASSPASVSASASAAAAAVASDGRTPTPASPAAAVASPSEPPAAVEEPEPLAEGSIRQLRRLADQLGVAAPSAVMLETRRLVRAMGVSSPLTANMSPAQVHAVRTIMATVVDALAEGHKVRDRGDPLRRVVLQVLPSLQKGRVDDAARILHRHEGTVPPLAWRLLELFVVGERAASAAPVPAPPSANEGARGGAPFLPAVEGPEPGARPRVAVGGVASWREERPDGGTVVHAAPVQGGGIADRGPAIDGRDDRLFPVRLGLALLEETAADRAEARRSATAGHGVPTPAGALPALGPERIPGTEGLWSTGPLPAGTAIPVALHYEDGREMRPGVAGGRRRRVGMDRWADTPGGEGGAVTRGTTLVFLAAAVVASALGFSGVAVALGAGAAFMGFGQGASAPSDSRTRRR
jgi:hypothetical protein